MSTGGLAGVRGAVSIATVLVSLVAGCGGAPYRTTRIESQSHDPQSGTMYFIEVRRGREVPNGTSDELATNDEVTTVIVCNDRTPEVCVRVLPDTLRTVEETRDWSRRLNETLSAQAE